MSVPFGAVDRMYPAGLEALAGELAKHIKSEQDITALSRQLLKLTVESALKAELDEHLGYERHAPAGCGSGRLRHWKHVITVSGGPGAIALCSSRIGLAEEQTHIPTQSSTPLSTVRRRIIRISWSLWSLFRVSRRGSGQLAKYGRGSSSWGSIWFLHPINRVPLPWQTLSCQPPA